jgi:signal transduction histidine kinase
VQFKQGRIAARKEERNRITKAYHEEVFSSMIAALFLIETAKNELQEAGYRKPRPFQKHLTFSQ